MGYHAPSADEVYRYVFHLDRPNNGSLTDGFCWSILFLNDNSAESREFLRRYTADLCFRTADRVRFVFFSYLTTNDSERLAQGGNRGGGFLGRILDAVSATLESECRSYDQETPPWDLLRPPALRPLRDAESIEHRLSMECEIYSAMPGSQEAFLLAQRLGIARFLPCFLVFTDIGAPQVHLLPAQRRPADATYARLCSWIDTFYEVNRHTLDHWRGVEREIVEISSEANASMSAIRHWADQRRRAWDGLKSVSACLLALRRAPLDDSAQVLRAVMADDTSSWEFRQTVHPFLQKFTDLQRRNEAGLAMTRQLEQLDAATTPAELLRLLHSLLQTIRDGQAAPDEAIVLDAIVALGEAPRFSDPVRDLHAWWRSEFGRPISRRKYDSYRKEFRAFSDRLHGATAQSRVGSIKRARVRGVSSCHYDDSFLGDRTGKCRYRLETTCGALWS